VELISQNKLFGGVQQRYRHFSKSNQCDMVFAIYLPPQAEKQVVPVLYWLSGLTCTDENFVTKAGAQRVAAELGIAIVAPDTSPRGEDVPDDPDKAYDFGLGAGFYLNATQAPWSQHYHMYDYVVSELPALIQQNFKVTDKKSISGHSMGGHGALSVALKQPHQYCSVSAFSPITNPTQCPWGQKAFANYLGDDQSTWQQYDTCKLIEASKGNGEKQLPVMVSQGTQDDFLEEQLKPQNLQQACDDAQYPLQLKLEEGYDHSYFFISTFIEDHLRFHYQYLI
jgi:S-formylglutathione hydrolase